VTSSALSAVANQLPTPTPAVEWLHLSPHPNAPNAARDFVTGILDDWRLNPVIPFASLAISELVSDSMHTDTSQSVAWNLGALRLSVRDHSPYQQHRHYSHTDPQGAKALGRCRPFERLRGSALSRRRPGRLGCAHRRPPTSGCQI